MNAPLQRDPYRDNLRDPHGFRPLRVEGRLPDGLAGTLYRSGPGLYERFGARVGHPFFADGAISAIRLDGRGGAQGAARIVEGDGYREEQVAGRRLYGPGAPWHRQVLNVLRQRDKATGNTSVVSWQGRLFALMEGSGPVEISPSDLSTVGQTDLGAIVGAFSAHPHRVPARRTTYNFGLRYGRQTEVLLYALPDAGPARQIGQFTTPWAGMVHDFIATDRHLIFVICPAQLNLARALLGGSDFSSMFRWRPDEGCEIVVVPIDAPAAITRIRTEAFWVWHFANASEDGDAIAIDLIRHDDLGSLDSIRGDAGAPRPDYRRLRVDLRVGDARLERVLDRGCEFPTVHPARAGQRHRYTWLLVGGERQGVARLDLETGDLVEWLAAPGQQVSEPIFAPRFADPAGAQEGDGHALTLVYDPETERSFVAVLDSDGLADGPAAKVWFEQAIPMTFHGVWVG